MQTVPDSCTLAATPIKRPDVVLDPRSLSFKHAVNAIATTSQSQAASRGHRTIVEVYVYDECYQRQSHQNKGSGVLKPWRLVYCSLRRIAFGVPPMNAGCCRLRPVRIFSQHYGYPLSWTTLNPLPCSGRIQPRHPVNTASVASTAPDTSRPTSGVYQARSPICHSCRTCFVPLWVNSSRSYTVPLISWLRLQYKSSTAPFTTTE